MNWIAASYRDTWSPLTRGVSAIAVVLALFSVSAPLARAQVPPLGSCGQWQDNRQSWIDKRNNGDLAGMSQAAWQAELTRLDDGILVLCGEGPVGDSSPPPDTALSGSDITGCLPTNNIGNLLGNPTRFHSGDDAQHANFSGPTGATLQVERIPLDGATAYQQHVDEGLAHPGWQLAGVDGLGDRAFAADRGGDSRSLVILQGDQVWLLHMDGVPAGKGFPQLGAIARSILNSCP